MASSTKTFYLQDSLRYPLGEQRGLTEQYNQTAWRSRELMEQYNQVAKQCAGLPPEAHRNLYQMLEEEFRGSDAYNDALQRVYYRAEDVMKYGGSSHYVENSLNALTETPNRLLLLLLTE